MWTHWWCRTQSCSASWPVGTMKLFSIMTYHPLVVIQIMPQVWTYWWCLNTNCVRHQDLPKQWACSALWHTTSWWSYKIMPQMWTYWWCLKARLFSIMTCWNNELVQHNDNPSTGGHIKSCHRCGLTDDAWTQICSASWLAGTKNLFSTMTYHLMVVIRDHATDVGLLTIRNWWCLNTKLFSIMTCWNNEVVQHNDIPPIGGHTKSCHRCGLTDDAWTQSCSASWPAGTINLFSIMKYHQLVVIRNHAICGLTDDAWTQNCSATWPTCWNKEVVQRYDIPPIGGHTKSCHRCGLTDDPCTQSCTASWSTGTMKLSALWHTTNWWSYEIMPQMWTYWWCLNTKLFGIITWWNNELVKNYDIPPIGGHTKIMPQMWTYWWCLKTKLFSIMTCWNNELVQHYDIPPVGGHTRSCHRCGLTDDAWTQNCSASWPAGTIDLFSIMTYHPVVDIQNHATDVDLLMMPETKVFSIMTC